MRVKEGVVMTKNILAAKVLAFAGTLLILLPTFLMLVSGLGFLIRSGRLMVDYLLPAEFGLVELVGFVLLLAAAFLSKSHVRMVAFTFLGLVVVIGGGMILAQTSGLATGETEPAGTAWALVLGSIVIFDLLIVALGVIGILLLIKLFKEGKPA